MIGGSNALNSANVIPNNGYVIEAGSPGVIAHCVTGVPPGTAGINSFLGGWFCDSSQLPEVVHLVHQWRHVALVSVKVILDLKTFTDVASSLFITSEEGVYECITVVGGPVITDTLTLNVLEVS